MTHDYKDDLYWIITNGHFDETDTAKLTECMQSIEHALQLAQQSVDLQKKAKKLRKERYELAIGMELESGCFTDEDCDALDKARKLAKKVRNENGQTF